MATNIKMNEHVFCAGMTQSGKTFLTQSYLADVVTQIYVLDTKGLFDWKQVSDKEKTIVHRLADIPKAKTIKVIYRPIWEELNQECYNAFFEFCMKRRNCTIVVDEVMQVCPSALKMPDWYKGALTRGMELNVGVWSLSQRPSNIPITVLSESTHYFIFKLNAVSDRKRIVEYTGHTEFMQIPEGHCFWYFSTTKGQKPFYGKLTTKGR